MELRDAAMMRRKLYPDARCVAGAVAAASRDRATWSVSDRAALPGIARPRPARPGPPPPAPGPSGGGVCFAPGPGRRPPCPVLPLGGAGLKADRMGRGSDGSDRRGGWHEIRPSVGPISSDRARDEAVGYTF